MSLAFSVRTMTPLATARDSTLSPPVSPFAPPTTAALRHELACLSDITLVERTRERDPLAFQELLGRHEGALLRLAQRLVRNDNDAQEVLQEVFITTWKKLGGFQDRAQVGSWLYRVTVNASLMHLRLRKRRISAITLDADESASDVLAGTQARPLRPDQHLESQETRRILQDAIAHLPPVLRTVLISRDVHGCSTRETGSLLGLTDVAVKTRLFRARRALRENIKNYFRY